MAIDIMIWVWLNMLVRIFYDEANKYAHDAQRTILSSIIETKAILKSFMQNDLAKSRTMETAAMKKLFGSEDNIKAVEKFFARKK